MFLLDKMENPTGHRIESIDALRGIVMVLMALDHARDYFGVGSFFFDPTNLGATTPLVFLTRWITHFCAPVFVFLAGTSVYLYGTRRNSKKEIARFLLARGAWLVFLELTIVNFAWTFDVTLSFHILQVIWAIGISMIFLSVIIFLPKWTLLAAGTVLVAGHNALDLIHIQETTVLGFIWSVLHQRSFIPLGQNSTICLV